jgi:hypothetical protein
MRCNVIKVTHNIKYGYIDHLEEMKTQAVMDVDGWMLCNPSELLSNLDNGAVTTEGSFFRNINGCMPYVERRHLKF